MDAFRSRGAPHADAPPPPDAALATLPRAAKAAVRSALTAAASDPYGDGDQSPLSTRRGPAGVAQGAPLRAAVAGGLDVAAAAAADPFAAACVAGAAADVAAAVAAARSAGGTAAVARLVERRVSLRRLSAVGVVVFGARLGGGAAAGGHGEGTRRRGAPDRDGVERPVPDGAAGGSSRPMAVRRKRGVLPVTAAATEGRCGEGGRPRRCAGAAVEHRGGSPADQSGT